LVSDYEKIAQNKMLLWDNIRHCCPEQDWRTDPTYNLRRLR
jgi:hypothetical protein